MPDYDFHTLSPADFELLTRDLLQARDGAAWESFKAGRDGGVDLRRAHGPDQSVVQCKHYARSGYEALLRDLKKEALKLSKLSTPVKRYLVSTSVDLSLAQKESIAKVFGAICATEDILGRDDLNRLLGQHGDIERQHYKLWLSSTPVLQRVLHNAEQTESDFEVARVHKNIRRFVPTAAYPQAREKLAKERVVILSGTPGIGKTTLAEMLIYEQLEEGSQAIVIRNDFKAARKLYSGKGEVIFYYDDFLGATFLGDGGSPLSRNEDREIVDFIDYVLATPQARLVLTTREHLLVQAKTGSERLRHAMVDRHKLMVTLGGLTRRKRAQILYNHIYFSDLTATYRQALLSGDFYMEIIRHEKFSPRLVQWLCDLERVRASNTSDYRQFVRDLLRDPSEIWRHAYEKQISEESRSLLLSLHSLAGEVSEQRLKAAFDSLHAGRAAEYGFGRKPGDFVAALRELTGTFIRLDRRGEVRFLDPSVMDLMNAVLRGEPDNALDITRHAVALRQIKHCWMLASAPSSERLETALRTNSEVHRTALERLRGNVDRPLVGHFASNLEEWVSLTLHLAFACRETLLAMVEPAVAALRDDWASHDEANVSEAVEIITLLESDGWPAKFQPAGLAEGLKLELIRQAEERVDPRDALLLLQVLDGQQPEVRGALTAGISWWKTWAFPDVLHQINSSSELGKLLDQLEELQPAVDVNLEGPIDAVQDEKARYEEIDEAYADAHMDEYKERWRDERADQESFKDLFDSLSSEE